MRLTDRGKIALGCTIFAITGFCTGGWNIFGV